MRRSFIYAWLLPLIFYLTSSSSYADPSAADIHGDAHDKYLEEIVVSGPFQAKASDTLQPVNVLAGESLLEDVANSLGETLKEEIGINNASFGPGVGHPIIRGHTGNRIGVMQNGVGTTDVANQSPDHAEGVEVSLANRIEIIRGPASLLYGSGAIGGVVNVIDGRIPEVVPAKPKAVFEQTYNDNNSESRSLFRIDAGKGNFALHLEGFNRSSSNVEIPGLAIDTAAVEALDALRPAHEGEGHDDHEGDEHEGDDHDDHDDHDDEVENTFGFIGNSDSEATSGSIGLSFVTDRGFLGASVTQLTNRYGLPPGSHTHAHGDEHGMDHDEEAHDDDDHEEELHDDDDHGDDELHDDHGEEVEFVRLDIEKTRYDLRGGLNFAQGWAESLKASFSYTDYTHDEVEYFDDGGSIVGTTYDNEGSEGRISLQRRTQGDWSGTYGLQFAKNQFSAIGEEAFIPQSDINNLGVFAFERYQRDRFNIELGLRLDKNKVETGSCERSETEFSASGSFLFDVNDTSNAFIGLTRAARTPSVEELFANVDNQSCARTADDEALTLHAATNLLEIGNPDLAPETSSNFEFGYRLYAERVTGEISLYTNQIDNYIYLNVDGSEFEEQLFGQYEARDATFKGVEGRVIFNVFASDKLSVNWSLTGDLVNAEFDAGGKIPRIPAAKIGSKLEFFGDQWVVHAHAFRVERQDETGEFEFETDGYNLVSIYADYHWDINTNGELKLFFRGDNLLDEEVRNHASLLKNFAPEAGRSFKIGLRYRH